MMQEKDGNTKETNDDSVKKGELYMSLNYNRASGGSYPSISQNESAYSISRRKLSAQIAREEQEWERQGREESKRIYKSLVLHMIRENQRTGKYSEVIKALQGNSEDEAQDMAQHLPDKKRLLSDNSIRTSYWINRNGYTDDPNLSAVYNTTVPNENGIPLTTAIGAAIAYDPEEPGNMIDSWKVLANEIEASIPDEVKRVVKEKAKEWIRNLAGTYVDDLIRFIPMPPHLRGAVTVGYFFTITVCEALMEVQMKHAQELEAIRNNPAYSEAQIKQMMQDKTIGWFLEEGGKEILNRMLDNVLERYHVPMHLRNQIKTAWSTFIVGDVWLGHWQTVAEREIKRILSPFNF